MCSISPPVAQLLVIAIENILQGGVGNLTRKIKNYVLPRDDDELAAAKRSQEEQGSALWSDSNQRIGLDSLVQKAVSLLLACSQASQNFTNFYLHNY